jgi:hypothetical protein
MSGNTEVLQTAASPANTASGVESRPELERVRVADLQVCLHDFEVLCVFGIFGFAIVHYR